MKKILYLLTGMALIVSASCSMNKVLPYYTEPAKIATLKKGMTLPEVNNHLGISPFDVYHIQKTGGSIIAYKYRFKKRAVPYNITAPENLNIRKSQTSGTIHYEEEKNLFIYYLKGKVQSLLTGGGRADSRNVLIANNTLRLIADKELVALRERSKLYHEGQVLHFNQLEGFSSVGSNYAPAPQFDAGINNQLTEQLQLDDFDVSPEPSNSRFSSVNSAIISESFYDQLPPGRNAYHPRRVADFTGKLPGKSISILGTYLTIGTLGVSRLLAPKANSRIAIRDNEIRRRRIIKRFERLSEKGKMNDKRLLRFNKRMDRYEDKIIKNYNKLDSMNAVYDKKGIIF